MRPDSCLVVYAKPPRPGRVKTRLIGELTPGQASDLHRAFLEDLLERLSGGSFALRIAWALDPGEEPPRTSVPGLAQEGGDLGERLYRGLSAAARHHPRVAAVGSDHPDLPLDRVEEAFAALTRGAGVVLGPARDGGYYLVATTRACLSRRLFQGIEWSTGKVLAATVERCRELGLEPVLLSEASDVDTPADLARLAASLAGRGPACPRTRALLAAWGKLPAGAPR